MTTSNSGSQDDRDESTPNLVLFFLRILSALAKSWKLLVLGGAFFLVVVGAIILSMQLTYEAKATVLFTDTKQGAAETIMKEAGMGGGMLGGSNTLSADQDEATSLLHSERLAFWAFRRFRLDTVGGPRPEPIKPEDVLKVWRLSLKSEIDENNALDIAYRSTSPAMAAAIVEETVNWLDSTLKAVHQTQTRQNLAFVEEQLTLHTAMLDSAEDRLLDFQKRNKVFALPEQVQASVEGSARLESEAMAADLQAKAVATSSGTESSEFRRLAQYRDDLRNEARKVMDNSGSYGATKGLSQGLNRLGEQARLQRDILTRKSIYSFLVQQREQLLLESKKSVSRIYVLDRPYVPQKRVSPPRRVLFCIAFVAWTLVIGSYVLVLDAVRRRKWNESEKEIIVDLAGFLPSRWIRHWFLRNFGIE